LLSWLYKILGIKGPTNAISASYNKADANHETVNVVQSNIEPDINPLWTNEKRIFNWEGLLLYDKDLRQVIDKSALAEHDHLIDFIKCNLGSKLASLPAFPVLAAEIFEAVRKPDAQIGQIVSLVGRDPAISAEVLKVANSAFSANISQIDSLRDAITRIGLRETARAATVALAGPLFDPGVSSIQRVFRPLWDRLWKHSVVTSIVAGQLASEWHTGDPMRLFLAGILHDIGKTFILRVLGELVVSGRVKTVPLEIIEILYDLLHAQIGEQIAKLWKLPNFVITACERHHELDLPSSNDFREIHFLRTISAIEEICSNPMHDIALEKQICSSFQAINLGPRHLRPIAVAIRSAFQKVGHA
jgi:HD-like signal output (HDOD) protein